MPASSGFRPHSDAIATLVRTLRDSRFVGNDLTWTVGKAKCTGSIDEALVATLADSSSDVCLRWQVQDLATSGLRYPLAAIPGPDGVYFDLEIHLVGETAYRTSEIVQPFEEIHCVCGEAIPEDWDPVDDPFGAARLPTNCPECAAQIDYAALPMTILDPMTGAPEGRSGGITYRCAVVVDCGKYYPDYGTQVDSDLIAVLTPVLGGDLRTVQDFY